MTNLVMAAFLFALLCRSQILKERYISKPNRATLVQYRARKQAADRWDCRLLTRAVLLFRLFLILFFYLHELLDKAFDRVHLGQRDIGVEVQGRDRDEVI